MGRLAGLICLSVLGSAALAEIAERVEDFEAAQPGPAEGWTLRGTNGWASKMIVVVQERPEGDRQHLQLDYDFTRDKQDGMPVEGLKYIVCNTRIPLPHGTSSLSVDVLGDGQDHTLVCSVTDAEGEWFNFAIAEIRWEGWRTLTVPIADNFHSHGRGDGVIGQPVHFSGLNITGDPRFAQQGSLGFDNIVAHHPAGAEQVALRPAAPSDRLLSPGTSGELELWLDNRGATDQKGRLEYALYRGVGPASPEARLGVGAAEWECRAGGESLLRLRVPTSGVGYYRLEGRLMLDGGGQAPLLASYAVMPEPAPDPDLTFGIGTFYEASVLGGKLAQAEPVIRRLGGSWTIAMLSWRKIEAEAEQYDWTAHDQALAAWPRDGPAILGAVGHMPDRYEPARDADAATRERLRGEFEPAYRSLAGAAAARYRETIMHWGLLHIYRRYYADAGAEGERRFARLLANTQAAILEAAPGASVISEMDLPAARSWAADGAPEEAAQLQAFYSEILYRAMLRPEEADRTVGGFVELISGWRGQRPVWLANAGFGWQPEGEPGEGEAAEMAQASDLVKALALSHYAAPGGHLHWWSLQDSRSAGAGLIRADGSPKPAACAFAAVCRLLAGSRPLQDWSAEQMRAPVFGRGPTMTLVAWSLDDEEHALSLTTDRSVEVVSVLGSSETKQPVEGKVELRVGRTPQLAVGQLELRTQEGEVTAGAIPPEAVAHLQAGMRLKHEGQAEQAAGELRAALELAPDYLEAHWALAWVCAQLGEKEEALAHFREVIRLAPEGEYAQEAAAAITRIVGADEDEGE